MKPIYFCLFYVLKSNNYYRVIPLKYVISLSIIIKWCNLDLRRNYEPENANGCKFLRIYKIN